MANLKLIVCDGRAVTPCGSGWKYKDRFYALWSVAAFEALRDKTPTEDELAARDPQWQDERVERGLEKEHDIDYRLSDKAMRLVILAVALLLSLMMGSCSGHYDSPRMATPGQELPLVIKIVGVAAIICGAISLIAAVGYSRGRTYHNRMEERAWKTRQYPSATKRNQRSTV